MMRIDLTGKGGNFSIMFWRVPGARAKSLHVCLTVGTSCTIYLFQLCTWAPVVFCPST
jgi:hypothetical protein